MVNRRLLAALKRTRYSYWAARKARATFGRLRPPRRLPGVPGPVHVNDFMLSDPSAAGATRYRTEALNVIAQIQAALDASGRSFDESGRWLDFGCGYGRVVRFLLERVDAERVYAADVLAEGVRFCESHFGVRGIVLPARLAGLQLERFDFLYAISVVTHLPEPDSTEFFRIMGEALEPGGIALFTTHGRRSLEAIERYGSEYPAMRTELEEQITNEGIAFVPYRFSLDGDYGMTWHAEGHVRARMKAMHGDSVKLLYFEPHGLDGHQDVWAFQRAQVPEDE